MATEETNAKLKEELVTLYTRYFGSMLANNYKQFYADKDQETVLLSAEGLLTEYAGESKGKQLLKDLCSKYNISYN